MVQVFTHNLSKIGVKIGVLLSLASELVTDGAEGFADLVEHHLGLVVATRARQEVSPQDFAVGVERAVGRRHREHFECALGLDGVAQPDVGPRKLVQGVAEMSRGLLDRAIRLEGLLELLGFVVEASEREIGQLDDLSLLLVGRLVAEDAVERGDGVEVFAAEGVNCAHEVLGAKGELGAARDGDEALSRLLEAGLIDSSNGGVTRSVEAGRRAGRRGCTGTSRGNTPWSPKASRTAGLPGARNIRRPLGSRGCEWRSR